MVAIGHRAFPLNFLLSLAKDKNMKRKKQIQGKREVMDIKKTIRIPTAPGIVIFKDKKRYSRKQKYKSLY